MNRIFEKSDPRFQKGNGDLKLCNLFTMQTVLIDFSKAPSRIPESLIN